MESGKEAAKAYNEAVSISQWNLEPASVATRRETMPERHGQSRRGRIGVENDRQRLVGVSG